MATGVFLKRVLPFLATFAVSVFVLSVVFSITPRPFRGHRHHWGKMKQEVERLRMENSQLRNENLRLRNDESASGIRSIDPATGAEVYSLGGTTAPSAPSEPTRKHRPGKR